MLTDCSADLFGFAPVESFRVEAAFDAGLASSDAGALLLGATNKVIGPVERFAACFDDVRRPELIEHEVATLVGRRVFGIALVQGGLTTCMELAAARVPFLYFRLHNHFEQKVHVRHRLQRYSPGRAMDYATAGSDEIAAAIVEELARPVAYRPVESDGAARAARMLAELL